MFAPFSSIDPLSRVWIYQAERKFTESEKTIIANHLQAFTEEWSAHSQALKTSFDIRYNQFIVLAADESHNSASGCSIDSSVRAIKQIGEKVRIDLFNRNLIAFLNGETVTLIPLNNLKEKYGEGTWNEGTLTFNNLVSVKSQLDKEWLVRAGDTWLKRYIPSKVTSS